MQSLLKQDVRKPASNRRLNLIAIMAACLGFCLAAQGQSSASLAWNPIPGPQVAGYYLHLGNASGVYTKVIDVGTNVLVTISDLTNGPTYYFMVGAYNQARVEGLPSNEAVFTVPTTAPPSTAPQITAINPGSAAAGTPVNINGVRFTGTTSVQFNGVNAAFTVSSDTLIVATVPAGATSGLLKITSPNGSVTGPFTVVATPTPANDNFASVQVLTGTVAMAAANTTGATKQAGEPGHAGNAGGGSVWYRWTAPATGVYSLDTVGSDFSTLLAVYTGSSLTGLSVVASNRTASGGFTNSVALNAAGGVTYQIAVDGVNGAVGNAALHLMPVTQAASTITVYSNSFESTDGFSSVLALAGQNGWLSLGTASSGFLNGVFTGLGEQACLGFGSPVPAASTLLYRPLNYTVDTNSRPVIQFSVTMELNNFLLRYSDVFGWAVRNAAGQELFRVSFDNGSRAVSYSLENGAGPVLTGLAFDNTSVYSFVITMDFSRNLWSASLNGTMAATNQPMTTRGAVLTLGDIPACETFANAQAPGLDGLVFDNYLVTAGSGSALTPKILLGPQNQTVTAGQNVVLGAVVSSGQPWICQWYCNGYTIAGATNACLVMNGATPSQSGTYSLVVSNASGSASGAAVVTITPPPPRATMAAPLCLGNSGASLNLSVAAGNNYRFQVSTNLITWVTLGTFFADSTNALCLDPAATNYRCRFYRVVSP
jgi:hypothetical protein